MGCGWRPAAPATVRWPPPASVPASASAPSAVPGPTACGRSAIRPLPDGPPTWRRLRRWATRRRRLPASPPSWTSRAARAALCSPTPLPNWLEPAPPATPRAAGTPLHLRVRRRARKFYTPPYRLQEISTMSAQPPPPILVLGTSERVGSNWVLDSLRHATVQHNEPLRQQLGREHPLAPMAAAPASGANSATGLAAYWVDVFQRSKYHGGQHLIKETNLYFTAASLLELFPDAPVVVLSRAPIGVAGSFARGGLWWRWGSAETYHRGGELAREQPDRRWVPLLPDEDPSAPVGLTRLIVLNAALLAEALRDRAHAHVSYESAVGYRQAAMAPVAHLLPDVDPVHVPDDRPKAAPAVDSTFATTRGKDRLIAYLPPETADAVASETKRCLDLVRCIAAPKTADTVERWLSGNDAYALAPAVAHVPPPRPSARRARIEPAYLSPSADGLRWRNLLVSNAEMAAFLNSLAAAGLANTRDGVRLLAVPMPHERGGRLHPIPQGWQVSPGYEHHPAYWVTWIG